MVYIITRLLLVTGNGLLGRGGAWVEEDRFPGCDGLNARFLGLIHISMGVLLAWRSGLGRQVRQCDKPERPLAAGRAAAGQGIRD